MALDLTDLDPAPPVDVAGYVAGLRAMADFFESNPAMVRPYQDITLHLFAEDSDEFTERARVLVGGAKLGDVRKSVALDWQYVNRQFGPHEVKLTIERAKVCERVQVGTKKVSKPDPKMVAAVPTVEVDEPVYEWKCAPLLEHIPEATA